MVLPKLFPSHFSPSSCFCHFPYETEGHESGPPAGFSSWKPSGIPRTARGALPRAPGARSRLGPPHCNSLTHPQRAALALLALLGERADWLGELHLPPRTRGETKYHGAKSTWSLQGERCAELIFEVGFLLSVCRWIKRSFLSNARSDVLGKIISARTCDTPLESLADTCDVPP